MISGNNDTLEISKKYIFNPNTNKYIFQSEQKFGKNVVFGKDKIDTIVKLYSNYDKQPFTAGEISLKLGIPKDVIAFILKSLNKTHDSLPFTEEKLEETDEEVLVDEMVNSKSFNILQKFEKKDWRQTQEDAEKWRELQYNTIDPFNRFMQMNWTPPKYIPKKYNLPAVKGNKELLIGCSDWHYGLIANKRYLFNQKEWNIEETEKAVDEYGDNLKRYIQENNKFKKLNVLFGGDLCHTLSGKTDKGTILEANPIGEEQLERAFNSIILFMEKLLSVHNNINIYACSGNHSSLGDYVLLRMVSLYFKTDKRLNFQVTNERHIMFNISDNLFLFEHGYSAVTKNRLPAPGKGRENYINNLFMSKPEKSKNTKRNYYISCDQHHSESYELTNVEGFMLPTLVGGCRHSDNSGYKSRQRQTCLVVEDEGVTEIKHFYFQ
jgi:hypothetical protein